MYSFLGSLIKDFVSVIPEALGPTTWPDPLGLLMGLWLVLVGQAVLLVYYVFMRFVVKPPTIQWRQPPDSTLASDVWGHVAQPESFVMLFGYLFVAWMWRLLPESYYDITTPVNWWHVLAQFLVVDSFMYAMHRLEHAWIWLYKNSHKPHHAFTNPKLYVAFNGSVLDTFCLILIPLICTAQVCRTCSMEDFRWFGTLYAGQLTLIHCEFQHYWDPVLELIGVGTAQDHNVHHLLFKYNYGHFFMYLDWIFNTYRSPRYVKQYRGGVDPFASTATAATTK